MVEVTALSDNIFILKDFFTTPSVAFQKINENGKAFLPGALGIIFILSLFGFMDGVTVNSLFTFVWHIGSTFVVAALVSYFGRSIYGGRGNYWGIFSCLGYTHIFTIFSKFLGLIPGVSGFILLPLALITLVLIIYFRLKAVSVSHGITMGQSFSTLLISGIVLFPVELGLHFFLEGSSSNIAGNAAKLILK